jgi:hypothetical protein
MSIVTGFNTEIHGTILDIGQLFEPGSSSYTTHMTAIGGQDIGSLFQGYIQPGSIPPFNTIYTITIGIKQYDIAQIFRPLNIINVTSGTPPTIINTSGTTYSLLFTASGQTNFTFNEIPISNITGYIIGPGGGGAIGTSGNGGGGGGGGGGTQLINISYSSITFTSIFTMSIGAGGAVNYNLTGNVTDLTVNDPSYSYTAYGGIGATGSIGGVGGGNSTTGTGGAGGTGTGSGSSGLNYGGGGGGGGAGSNGGGGGGVAYNFNTNSLLLSGGTGGSSNNTSAGYNGGNGSFGTTHGGYPGQYGGGGGGGGAVAGIGGDGCAILTFTLPP